MKSRIRATRKEFEAACANGCVYGKISGKRGLYVYAELGTEKEYVPSPKDDPMTEYRVFNGCDVFFAKTEEQLKTGDFEAEELLKVTVIIYC